MFIRKRFKFEILVSFLFFLAPTCLLSQGSEKLIVPHFVSHPDIQSYLFIADVEGTGPTVSVAFYSENGNKLAEEEVLVQKYGNMTVEPFKMLNRTTVGTIRLTSKGGSVVAEYWQIVSRPKEKEMYSVAVPAQPDGGNDVLILQHFVSHPDIESYIFISDANSMGPIVNIKFYSEAGELLKQARELVPVNGTLVLNVWNLLDKRIVGTAQIASEGGSIVGEYWQIVNRKFTKEERERKPNLPEREHYAVAVPLQGAKAQP